jgi:hypothetical protein
METSQNLGLYAFLLPFCSFMATATVERVGKGEAGASPSPLSQ